MTRRPARRWEPMAATTTLALTAAIWLAQPDTPASKPARPTAASQPTTQPDDPLIARLIHDLGASDFRRRNAAQARLTELGVTALPSLIRHINNPSPEIADRVLAIVQPPTDPDLRVELAVALLATARPEPMERAVYMMFDMPEACCERFLRAAGEMKGRDRLVGNAIADQFRSWRGQFEVFQRHYEKTSKRDPDAAARILKMQTDGNIVHAEAAFQTALDALETAGGDRAAPGRPPPATQPARTGG